MKNLSVLTVSYHQKELIDILIKSFEKFKPKDLNITYFVVENSDDTSYKKETELLADNVKWFNNFNADVDNGSLANGLGIEFAKMHIQDEYTFVCHSDVAVTCYSFFEEFFDKVEEGYKLIGTHTDHGRINAAHISGLLVTTELLQKVDVNPVFCLEASSWGGGKKLNITISFFGFNDGELNVCFKGTNGTKFVNWFRRGASIKLNAKPKLDVGDRLTEYCRENKIKYYTFKNTSNNPELHEVCNEPFRSLGKICEPDAVHRVTRCLNKDNAVMFVHLGRGVLKSQEKDRNDNKLPYSSWVEFIDKRVLTQ